MWVHLAWNRPKLRETARAEGATEDAPYLPNTLRVTANRRDVPRTPANLDLQWRALLGLIEPQGGTAATPATDQPPAARDLINPRGRCSGLRKNISVQNRFLCILFVRAATDDSIRSIRELGSLVAAICEIR
jgi:hypothetical protein